VRADPRGEAARRRLRARIAVHADPGPAQQLGRELRARQRHQRVERAAAVSHRTQRGEARRLHAAAGLEHHRAAA
jgi:hypothetical protein